jgi:GT2 family glycosyltransferase
MDLVAKRIACILCTKDRPNYVRDFLNNMQIQTKLPDFILIIDSSVNSDTHLIIQSHPLNSLMKLHYFESMPGLPRQRNLGISSLLDLIEDIENVLVAFLDDDVVINPQYYETLRSESSNGFAFAGLTGQPSDVKKINLRFLIYKFFLMDSDSNGSILPSGLTTTPRAFSKLEPTEWMCGLSMNIPLRLLKQVRFDESIRMYGEDLEMCLRLREFGPFMCSPNLIYTHKYANQGRQNIFKVTTYTLGIRWRLAKEYPKMITKSGIIWSLFGACVIDFFLLLCFNNPRERLQRLFGAFIFLLKLVFRKTLTEPYK